ncbi:MAG: isoleucine--tRNA ligase, partial [Alphaproteobacteria bacterium]|nr:isoleucine--tRNA ligase [Alphaproteobacteria bacterium]
GALELERANKTIGSSLEAAPVVYLDSRWNGILEGTDLAEICITSDISIEDFGKAMSQPDENIFSLPEEVAGVAVGFRRAEGEKCERCWRVLPDVGANPEAPGVCGRCADAVVASRAAAE